MRRRDLAAFVAAGILATAGVLTMPLGAQATEGPGVAAVVDEPTDGPSETPAPSPTGEPTPSEGPTPTDDPEPTDPDPTDPPTGEPEPSPTPTPSEDPDGSGEVEVDDAVFTWSMSEQTNARSHNPLAINFMSAGEANPGRGGIHLPRGKWKASQGKATIQKRTKAGRWRTATWDGLRTDADGNSIGLYGPFSGHRVQLTGGTGTVDPGADDAKLSWKGTWTVVYYSGNTVFTLTDPVLEVQDGKGELRARGGGWAADRVDLDEWNPVTPEVVPVVTFSKVDVTDEGLVVEPDYAGVQVEGSVPQKRSGDAWGSFPQEFISFLEPMGTDQFWYSTGLQSDWTKVPTPIRVGWQGAEPETPAPTKPRPPQPEPSNPVTTAPPVIPAPVPQLPTPSLPTSVPQLPAAAPLTAETPWQAFGATGTATQVTAAAPQDLRLTSASSSTTPWVVGGAFLLGAALLLLVPVSGRSTR